MFAAPKHFGIGEKFMALLKMLYVYPKSAVITDCNKSVQIKLHHGTRQGCCLSPLLFDLALEPLAVSIRAHPLITGIIVGATESLIGLYINNVVLTLSSVQTNLPPPLQLIIDFSKLSGFSLNRSKSLLISLTDDFDASYLDSQPFKICTGHFVYLGLKISRKPKQLFKLNYLDWIAKLKKHTERRRLWPLSLIGQINAVKMVILPKFTDLFQNLILFLTPSFFHNFAFYLGIQDPLYL